MKRVLIGLLVAAALCAQTPVTGPAETVGTTVLDPVNGVWSPDRIAFNQHLLLNWKQVAAAIRQGTAVTLVHAWIGDSTYANGNIANPFIQYAKALYGDGGYGWISASSYGATLNSGAAVTRLGTWTDRDMTSSPAGTGPNGTEIDTVDVSTPASVSFTCPAPTTDMKLMYGNITGGGTFSWNADSGAQTGTFNTSSGTTLRPGGVTVTGLSAAAAHTLLITATGAGTHGIVYGVDCQNNGVPGYRAEVLGNSGTEAITWNAMNTAQWEAEMALLTPILGTIQFGANEKSGNWSPTASFQPALTTLLTNFRTAAPAADGMIMTYVDTSQTGKTYTMAQYAAAAKDAARLSQAPFLDTYQLIPNWTAGDANGMYGGSHDTIHVGATGGERIADALIEFLTDKVPQRHVITFTVTQSGDLGVYPVVDFACLIYKTTVSSDAAGALSFDVWKLNLGIPVAGNKISASAPVTLSSSNLAYNGTALSTWTKSVVPGDVFSGTASTFTTLTKATVQLWCK